MLEIKNIDFEETMVSIPLKRYKELIDIETRVKVAVRCMREDKAFNITSVLRVIGK